MSNLNAVKVSDRVYWVGAIDWNIRDFHGYATQRGSTYNAYLVMGEKPILIDTVKAPFKEELLARINSVIDPKKIKYIISNHTEMDHSGLLPDMIEIINPEKVFASVKGQEALNQHFKLSRELTPVKNGESMKLGDVNFTFLETRMLHWPDSMFSYMHEEKFLFSSDAFGMHLASSERFDDEIDSAVLEYEGKKYYANIIAPYSPLVLKLLDKVAQMKIELKTIAPDHGPVWRKDIPAALAHYRKWAEQKPTRKAVVVYDTMWQSTAKMANAIADGLIKAGISVKVLKLRESHRSDLVTESIDAAAIVAGSPTLNNNLFPTVADALVYLKGLRPQNKIGAVFGSYGWSGEANKYLKELLESMKIPVVAEMQCQFVPTQEVLDQAAAMGTQLAEKIKEAVK
jgi:flavorubredoxin